MPDQKTDHHKQNLGEFGYTQSFSTPWGHASDDPDPPLAKRHYGKFRGTVVSNTDPYQKGRLLVEVPGIVITNWAEPCLPLTDIAMGVFMRPRVGANIWVEFERGDPDKPIWVGGYWGPGETPLLAKAANAVPPTNSVLTMETASAGVSVCDVPIAGAPLPGAVILRAGGVAATISMTPGGVTITAPIVKITALTAINISAPAVSITGTLTVTGPTGVFTVA
jgi:hypothetical protein